MPSVLLVLSLASGEDPLREPECQCLGERLELLSNCDVSNWSEWSVKFPADVVKPRPLVDKSLFPVDQKLSEVDNVKWGVVKELFNDRGNPLSCRPEESSPDWMRLRREDPCDVVVLGKYTSASILDRLALRTPLLSGNTLRDSSLFFWYNSRNRAW